MAREDFIRLAREVEARCREHGALLVLNGDAELAERLEVGLHLPTSQLMALHRRPDLEWVGASCHGPGELAHAAGLTLDWVVLAPILPTSSHPHAQPLGWEALEAWVRDYPLPVFALGGMSHDDLSRARELGAHGVALRSGAWSGSQPLAYGGRRP
jgi:8-oxo-dGTP diphosphatase